MSYFNNLKKYIYIFKLVVGDKDLLQTDAIPGISKYKKKKKYMHWILNRYYIKENNFANKIVKKIHSEVFFSNKISFYI